MARRYSANLEKLARLPGIVGTTFLKAPNEIRDPSYGTSGFLLAVQEHICKKPRARNAEVDTARWRFPGIDIVPEVVRWAR